MTTTAPIRDTQPTILTRTRLTVDGRHPRIRDAVVDAHLMHALVMDGFTDHIDADQTSPRAALRVLYTQRSGDNRIDLLVQADTVPDYTSLPGLVSVTDWDETPPEHGRVAFQLTAAPATNTTRPADGGPRRPRRPITDPAEQQDWLHHKLARNGLAVDQMTSVATGELASGHKSKPRPQRRTRWDVFHHATVTVTGAGTITDPGMFTAALRDGIGPAKAYGCGLLLARPL